jgi:hypothetical protein
VDLPQGLDNDPQSGFFSIVNRIGSLSLDRPLEMPSRLQHSELEYAYFTCATSRSYPLVAFGSSAQVLGPVTECLCPIHTVGINH